MENGFGLFLAVLAVGFVLQLYFIGWRKKHLKDGTFHPQDLHDLWMNQRRAIALCYFFGGGGITAQLYGRSFLEAFLFGTLLSIVLLFFTRRTR